MELLPQPFLFGPKPLGELFPFLCLLRGFFFTPFGVFPANREEQSLLSLTQNCYVYHILSPEKNRIIWPTKSISIPKWSQHFCMANSPPHSCPGNTTTVTQNHQPILLRISSAAMWSHNLTHRYRSSGEMYCPHHLQPWQCWRYRNHVWHQSPETVPGTGPSHVQTWSLTKLYFCTAQVISLF